MSTEDIPEGFDAKTALETNRRLNYRNQELEKELATFRRAVRGWQISEKHAYIPMSTINDILKACGKEVPERLVFHGERMRHMEMAMAFVKNQASRWAGRAPADDWGDTPADTALADGGRSLLKWIEKYLDAEEGLPDYRTTPRIIEPNPRSASAGDAA